MARASATAVAIASPNPELHTRSFSLNGRVLSAASNDPWSLHLMSAAYDCMVSGDLAGSPIAHRAGLVRRAGTLSLSYDGAVTDYAHAGDPDPFVAPYHAVQEMFARFASSLPGFTAVYGASLAVNGRGVLLIGPSCIGKTVLAAHLIAQGAHFLGDETVLVSEGPPQIRAMPRRPALREPALALLPPALRASVDASPLFRTTPNGRFWYALPSTAFGGIEPDAGPHDLRAIAVVLGRSESAECVELSAAAAFPHVVKRAYDGRARSAAMLHAATQRTRCYGLQLGEPAATAALLLEKLESCA